MTKMKSRFIFIILLLSLIFIPCILLVSYDVWVFQPKLAEIRADLQRAPLEDQHPPPLVKQLILSETKDNLANYVMRVWSIKFNLFSSHSQLQRQCREIIWMIFINFHVSLDEQIAYYSSFSFNGYHSGLTELSINFYNKPLSALSTEEVLSLLHIIKAPSHLRYERAR